jgi:uncharacterized protein
VDLRDQVIVITGASSGFGEAIARRCAARGARVVLAARSAERIERLADELGAGQGRALAVPTDVASDDDSLRLAQAALEGFGRVDVLVNNAGFGILDRLTDARLTDFQEMIEVNLFGAVRCIQAFLPHMLAGWQPNGGSSSRQIVIMASLAGLIATRNMGFYNASKFALIGLGRTLMLELYGTGVRCALICPGPAPTGFQTRADSRKYARVLGLARCTSEQVAAATVRAIDRRTHGEVIVPRYATPLITIGAAFPRLARLFLRIVR